MSHSPCTIGIDVSKTQLDLAVHPSGEQWSRPNDEAGIRATVARVAELRPMVIVLEATGGLQVPLVGALAAAGLPGPAFPSFASPAELRARCDGAIARANTALRALERRPVDDGWLAAYDDLNALLEDLAGPIYLLSNVHPDKAMRAASDACELRWQDFTSSLGQNAPLYRASGRVRARDPIDALLLKTLREDFEDAIADDALANGREIAGALQGRPGFRLRNTPDGKAVIVSAAHPIWNGDEVAGAVVVEESTNPILSVRSRALERLLALTLAAFVVAAAVLIGFATRLSTRIRRLRDEAETAIDARGRLAHLVTAQNAGDEIGDLSRSFSAMLAKLAQHHAYLESMASRLSHELRTPIAVVRSSLENLKLAPAEARIYIERAEEGLARLATILTRMSEASRLEQGLASLERERFDLAVVVSGCLEGYRLAYSDRPFELALPREAAWVRGSPDLAAQLLDKLVANAVDFSRGHPGPVRVRLALDGAGHALLAVANKGPLLPEAVRGKLFEAMVSVRGERAREGGSAEPHLGLGLYVARLIEEIEPMEKRVGYTF